MPQKSSTIRYTYEDLKNIAIIKFAMSKGGKWEVDTSVAIRYALRECVATINRNQRQEADNG